MYLNVGIVLGLCGVCGAAAVAAAAAPVVATTDCRVRFEATWSAATHPVDFPAGAHFSTLIGATHDDAQRFWQAGAAATPGVVAVAETGATATFRNEIAAAGNAAVVSGSGAGSPDVVTLSFSADAARPLLTLITMIAPSPDWFIGVSALALRDGGRWVENKTVELLAWDAGSDAGASYLSADSPQTVAAPIALVDSGPAGNGVPFGTFTVDCDNPPDDGADALFQNGFDAALPRPRAGAEPAVD